MKLRELLQQMGEVQKRIGSSKAYICGGTPRDRYLKHLENISDLDITTGDKTVGYLSSEFGTELAKKYNVTQRNHDDGHSSIYIGSFKMDFSSNFNVPGIDDMLAKQGIARPTEMQKEMFSRDFTCNALLLSLDLKNVIDPTHKGFKDLNDRIIRTCLSPEITLTSNKNRVIRAIYLASKLDFDIDPSIVEYVSKNPQSVKISTERVMAEKLNEAFNRNPERAAHYISKMGLWQYIPITEVVQPYYMKSTTMKKAYFQGGGGVNEPTPKEKKYKSDPAIVVQPRFKEPFYRNYDIYEIPGYEHIGPGAGWHALQNYKSVSEFLEARRERLSPRYKSDDSWQVDSGERVKKNPDMAARAALLSRIIKTAGDENDGPNFDYGDSPYTAMSEGKKMKSITDHDHKSPGAFFADDNDDHMLPPKEHGTSIYNWKNSPYQGTPKAPKKHDSNDIDFPVDDSFDEGPIHFNEETVQEPRFLGPSETSGENPLVPTEVGLGDETSYPYSAEIGGDQTYPYPDFEGKMINELDFGRDYSEDFDPKLIGDEKLHKLLEKYLSPAPTHGLYGLPDGVDMPDEDVGDPTDINPDYGTLGPDSLMYEDKWNI